MKLVKIEQRINDEMNNKPNCRIYTKYATNTSDPNIDFDENSVLK